MALPAQNDLTNSATNAAMQTLMESQRDFISTLLGGGPKAELTIGSGTITPGVRDHGGVFSVDTQGDASTDDLDTITNTNVGDGQLIMLMAENASRVVTLKHADGGVGEMLMLDSADIMLDSLNKWVLFRRAGSSFVEVLRYVPDNELATLTNSTIASGDLFSLLDISTGVRKAITQDNLKKSLSGIEVIETGTISGASKDFANLSADFFKYELVLDDIAPATDGALLRLQTSNDNGSSFDSGASDYNYSGSDHGATGFADLYAANNSHISLGGQPLGNAAGETLSGVIRLINPMNSAGRTVVQWDLHAINQTGINVHLLGSGQRQADEANDAFRLQMSAGNLSGNYTLYGYRK